MSSARRFMRRMWRRGWGLQTADGSDVDHHVLLLHRHRHGLCHVGPLYHALTLGDLHRVGPHLDAVRLAVRLAGADVEFPAMPGAADDLALARVAVASRLVRFDQA